MWDEFGLGVKHITNNAKPIKDGVERQDKPFIQQSLHSAKEKQKKTFIFSLLSFRELFHEMEGNKNIL